MSQQISQLTIKTYKQIVFFKNYSNGISRIVPFLYKTVPINLLSLSPYKHLHKHIHKIPEKDASQSITQQSQPPDFSHADRHLCCF